MDNYLAFFVAMTDFELFFDTFKNHCTGLYTIGIEYSKHSHKETNGQHYHVFADMTDKQYRALIIRLKYLKVPLNGRSKGVKTRSYGKVLKGIREPMKMLAYTIKGDNYITTESDDTIARAKLLSFEKEDPIIKIREIIMAFLDNEIDDKNPNLVQYKQTPVPPYEIEVELEPQYSILGKLKLLIIKYFRQNGEKMPSRSRLLYFAQYYCMYHQADHYTDEDILRMFY